MVATTEITSTDKLRENVIHQRLLFPYVEISKTIYGKTLELGCGEGRGYMTLKNRIDQYYGVDKNKQIIHLLKEKYPEGEFFVEKMPPLPKELYGKFDFVLAFQVIEHIKNDEEFVNEMFKCLKPNGKAIITTPNKKMSLTRNPWHIREYTSEEIIKLLQINPFQSITVRGIMGNDKVMSYYERNKKSIKKMRKWDIFNLEHISPRWCFQLPYEILNALNRKQLLKQNKKEVEEIHYTDYSITEDFSQCLDFFCVVTK